MFFADEWLPSYQEQHPDFLSKILDRSDLVVEDLLIYTDAMDMEACDIPYSIKGTDWNTFPEEDPEWLFMLSRHGFLVDLAMTYKITGEDIYQEKWRNLVLDFIRKNGHPNAENTLSWRPIDTGIRLTNWVKSLNYLDSETLFSSAEARLFEQAIIEQIHFLKESFISKYELSNWGILAITGILVTELFFPELVKMDEKEWAWKTLEEQIDLQFYCDGIHWEQSPLYHHEVVMSLLYILQVSEYTDYSLPFNLKGKLKQPIQASYYYADQKDQLNALNDSDSVDFRYVYDCYRGMGFLPQRQEASLAPLYIGNLYATCSTSERAMPTTFYGKQSGFIAIKTKDFYFTLFNGRHGSSHGHGTTGSLTLHYQGEDILIDSGRYTYLEESVIREKLKGEDAHNSITVVENPATDIKGSWGYQSLAEPLFSQLTENKEGYLVECAWNGVGKSGELILINRKIMLLKKIASLVICDTIQAQGSNQVRTNFNFAQQVAVSKVTKTTAELKIKQQKMVVWTDSESLRVRAETASAIYNQLFSHQRLTHCCKMKNQQTNLTAFGLNDAIQFEKVAVFQNKSSEITDLVKGLRIYDSKQKIKAELFFTPFDIVQGDKLFISETKQKIYGKVVLMNEKNKKVRF